MEILRELPSDTLEDVFFQMSLRSNSGANIRVGEKFYKVYINSSGKYCFEEFLLDFELSEEEFKTIFKQ